MELPDEEVKSFNLREQLREGPMVLVFYQGDCQLRSFGTAGSTIASSR